MAQSRSNSPDALTIVGLDESIQSYIPLSTLRFFPLISKEFNAIEQEANIQKKRMAELEAKLASLDSQCLEREGIKSEDAAIAILMHKSISAKFGSYVPPSEVDAPSSSSITVHNYSTSTGGLFKLGQAHPFAAKLILGNNAISNRLSPGEKRDLQKGSNPAKREELDYSRFMF